MSQPGNTEQPTHGGAQAVAAARAHGAQTMFTLSGGHVFPLYDGAVKADPPMRIVDVRHEQTAVFAAEATARLTRSPGFAVLTAGPASPTGSARSRPRTSTASPLVVLAGRAPDGRWGSGSLQELDHPPLLAPVTKRAWTAHAADDVGPATERGLHAGRPPGTGGRSFSTQAWRRCSGRRRPEDYGRSTGTAAFALRAAAGEAAKARPGGGRWHRAAARRRPSGRCWCLGSDVWMDGAEAEAAGRRRSGCSCR